MQPRATGTRKRLLVRKAMSARQRQDSREGNIALAFLMCVAINIMAWHLIQQILRYPTLLI